MSSRNNTARADPTFDLNISGMHCAACVARAERSLAAVPGVEFATVNLVSERARVRTDGQVGVQQLQQALTDAGFTAEPLATDRTEQTVAKSQERILRQRELMLAVILTLPVFVLEMGGHLLPGFMQFIHGILSMHGVYLLEFVLITLVLIGPGRGFFIRGIPALLKFRPDMDALVALGTGAAWTYSVVATLAPQMLPAEAVSVYFEAAGVIICLILLGRYLEAGAKARAADAVANLLQLQPHTARVLRGQETLTVALEEVCVGDTLQVLPGEKIPLDGVVINGSSYVQEALISGEPIPQAKGIDDVVVGGTLNTNGALDIDVTHIGQDTVLAQIVRMVEGAQAVKLPVQRLADEITRWFVPAVLLIAALTFVAWMLLGPAGQIEFALVNAVTVLIVACPCALGLATPISIVVATGRAAQAGILFQRGDALQILSRVRNVVMDKTGTLTEGVPAVTDIHLFGSRDRDTVLPIVAAVQSKSEHPIGRAIVKAASIEGFALPLVEDFSTVVGSGVSGVVDGTAVIVGSERLMADAGVAVGAAQETIARLAQQGKTPVYVAFDGQLVALIAVADPIKASAQRAVRELEQRNLQVHMLSGDHAATARSVAHTLGIENVTAQMTPAGKVEHIEQLAASDGALLFVGDGINDAPALARADVGMALASGTELAMDSADVVITNPNLEAVVQAIDLSSATMINIKQNLFWAFAYNVMLIPVATGMLYPFTGWLLSPEYAAAAMALSSLCVVANALRLRR